MEKKQTVVFKLLSAIPTGAEIKQFIFDNDADEKMLDEWLWAKVYKDKDWKQLEREQMVDFHIEVMKKGLIHEGVRIWQDGYLPKIKQKAEGTYTQTFTSSIRETNNK